MSAPTPPPSTQKPKVMRRQLLVERGFQLRYTVLLSAVGAVATGAFGGLVLFALRSMRAGLRLSPELQDAFAETDLTLTWLIIALTLLTATALAVFGLLLTHRVAGPVFVMNHYVNVLAKGRYPRLRSLRRHDELQSLFESFNVALESLRKREVEEAELLGKVLETLGPLAAQPDARQLLERLGAVRDRKRDATERSEPGGAPSPGQSVA